MKVAIFHDYFSTIGGGEKVVMTMAECLQADIFSTDISVPKSVMGLNKVSSLGNIPHHPFFRQMGSLVRFMQADLSDRYDMFIFSGNWAHHASFHHSPSLYYCNSPVRALYDLYPVFKQRIPWPLRPAYATWASVMQTIDQRSIRRVNQLVANSKNIQDRIRRYYHRNAPVIYPPIETKNYSCVEYGDFWLSVNRLYPEKRIEIQIEAFSKMPDQQLVIVGGFSAGDHAAPYARRIREMAKKAGNIQILGQIPDEQVKDLYSRCMGLVCTALEEDFGITPLEAMASGKPVVAVAEGGFLETVTPECGRFIRPESGDIIEAVREISRDPEQFRSVCQSRASLFDVVLFENAIQKTVTETYDTWSVSA